MRAAYDALDDETKAEIEDLVCEHSLIYSREAIGFFDLTDEESEHFQPVRHRLVRVEPRTGRKSLFLSADAGAIAGWTVPEARVFLRDLTEHATQPRFVYRHAGAPAIWSYGQPDNHASRPPTLIPMRYAMSAAPRSQGQSHECARNLKFNSPSGGGRGWMTLAE